MLSTKKRIFITGASGNMGQATLKQLFKKPDLYQITALALQTRKDREILAPYQKKGLKVVWGDLVCYEDVLHCINGADYVLHVGGLVSPLADTVPEMTMRVNVGAAENIVRAIKTQQDSDRIRLVYIGTVAQTGNRPAPIHWGRVGDPIKISTFDIYALSKTIAERIVIESGIKNWVSLRQTGIARMAAAEPLDPIIFHTTLDGVLEWITPEDSGRLLANICSNDIPTKFWGNIYNIGGGNSNRLTNLELFDLLLGSIGIGDFRDVLEPNWFATKNFHGQWFSDSDLLEALIPYRKQTMQEYVAEEIKNIPWYIRLGSKLPKLVRQKFKDVARGPRGTLTWLSQGNQSHIKAYFGSMKNWKNIPGWDCLECTRPSSIPMELDHGYDENLIKTGLTLNDVQNAALFRGGQLLSKQVPERDWSSHLHWRCHAGHEFMASLNLILKGGHWCPICTIDTDTYPQMAERSPFFRQVWEPALGQT